MGRVVEQREGMWWRPGASHVSAAPPVQTKSSRNFKDEWTEVGTTGRSYRLLVRVYGRGGGGPGPNPDQGCHTKVPSYKKAMTDLYRAVAQIGVDFPDLNVGAVLILCPFDYNNVDQITGIGS
jgi:hypothetical protein